MDIVRTWRGWIDHGRAFQTVPSGRLEREFACTMDEPDGTCEIGHRSQVAENISEGSVKMVAHRMKMEGTTPTREMACSTSNSLKPDLAAISSGSSRLIPAMEPLTAAQAHCVDHQTSSTKPVFIVGCPRSGTTLLYHMILSSGNFAGYPFESDTFRILGPKFPDLKSPRNRKRLMEFWLSSKNGSESGLDRSDIESRIELECRNIGDFLRIIMEEMCRKQGVHRWAEKTPDHVLSIAEIKRLLPNSLIVHIIRDGRDAALSLANFGRIQPYFCQRGSKLLSFGVYWKWLVRKGRATGKQIGRDYYELRYEDIMEYPRETLARLGDFIGHNLDYDRIVQVGVGSVSQPNTSFENLASPKAGSAVGRWRRQYSPAELARFEALVGDCLEETGYSLASPQQRRGILSTAGLSTFYISQLELKYQLKSHTPLKRLAGWKK